LKKSFGFLVKFASKHGTDNVYRNDALVAGDGACHTDEQIDGSHEGCGLGREGGGTVGTI
jgi:hypothetical protein